MCDCEADIFDFIRKLILERKHFLIRAVQNRLITEEHRLLKSEVETCPIAGEILVHIPRNAESKKTASRSQIKCKVLFSDN